MIEPLEIISLAARTGKAFDPREPRGTKPSYTWADVCGALGMTGDPMGADMALFVGAHIEAKRDEIQNYLVHYVIRCCNDEGIVPDLLKVGEAVERAMYMGQWGPPNFRGGGRYFRWAYGELMSRAASSAENMTKRLFREVA